MNRRIEMKKFIKLDIQHVYYLIYIKKMMNEKQHSKSNTNISNIK